MPSPLRRPTLFTPDVSTTFVPRLPARMGPRGLLTLAALGLGLSMTGCASPVAPQATAAFTIEVAGDGFSEKFVVEVTTEGQIQQLEARMASGEMGVIAGDLLPGNGGFNGPWSWHMDPTTVHAYDAATEVCDGRPSMVEADLDYWLHTLGNYCPWGARVVDRIL